MLSLESEDSQQPGWHGSGTGRARVGHGSATAMPRAMPRQVPRALPADKFYSSATQRRVCSRPDVGSVPDASLVRSMRVSKNSFPAAIKIRSVLCNVASASRSCRTPGECTVRWCTAAGGTLRSVLPRHCARLRQCRDCQKIFPLQHVPVWRYLDVCVCQRRRSAPMCDGADIGEAYKFRTQIFEVVFCTCLRWRRLAKVCAGYAGLRSPCYGQK